MKPIEVNEDYVNSVANFTSWERAGIPVLREEIVVEEDERVDERKSDKSKTQASVDDSTEQEVEDGLELLDALLAELSDEDLLEHASNMLKVFDAAAEELELLAEEEDEEDTEDAEVVDEEYEDEDIDGMSPALLRALLKAHREES